MDCLTTLRLIVGAFRKLSAGACEALAERLLTILLVILIIGGVSGFAVTAFGWLWIKRVTGEPQVAPVFGGARSAAGGRHIAAR